jgi:hypothetical protein
MEKRFIPHWFVLYLGDTITLALITVYGFASHGTLNAAGTRMLTTFLPLLMAWSLIAPHLRVFQDSVTSDWKGLWRPFWAMMLVAPLAAWIRGAWLNTPILPIFVVVLGGTSALALLAWRALYWAVQNWKRRSYG